MAISDSPFVSFFPHKPSGQLPQYLAKDLRQVVAFPVPTDEVGGVVAQIAEFRSVRNKFVRVGPGPVSSLLNEAALEGAHVGKLPRLARIQDFFEEMWGNVRVTDRKINERIRGLPVDAAQALDQSAVRIYRAGRLMAPIPADSPVEPLVRVLFGLSQSAIRTGPLMHSRNITLLYTGIGAPNDLPPQISLGGFLRLFDLLVAGEAKVAEVIEHGAALAMNLHQATQPVVSAPLVLTVEEAAKDAEAYRELLAQERERDLASGRKSALDAFERAAEAAKKGNVVIDLRAVAAEDRAFVTALARKEAAKTKPTAKGSAAIASSVRIAVEGAFKCFRGEPIPVSDGAMLSRYGKEAWPLFQTAVKRCIQSPLLLVLVRRGFLRR